jgi:hypothetical protein
MKAFVFAFACLAAAPALADSMACYRQCAAQGNDQSYCMTVCERNGGGGITQQPGVPKNPYLNAIPDPVPKEKPLRHIEPKCVDNCVARGYQYNYCRKQCSY